MNEREHYLTVREVAQYAKVAAKTVYRALAAKRLKGNRVNATNWRIKPQWVDEWLGIFANT